MNEAKQFAKFLIIHTDEVRFTVGPCRRYKGKVLNIDELYTIFLSF